MLQLQFGQNKPIHQFKVGGSRSEVLNQLNEQLGDLGYTTSLSEDAGLCILKDPEGKQVDDFWSAGFVEGSGNVVTAVLWAAPN